MTAYTDRAEGVMEVGRDGPGRFKSVVLRPTVTVATGSDVGRARALHKPAHEMCFIANSVNLPRRVRAGDRRGRLNGGSQSMQARERWR